MAVSQSYLEAVRELFQALPDLRIKRTFGGAGVFSGPLMFALAAEEELYLRVDEVNRAAFEAAGSAPFDFAMRNGETMTLGYWRAPDAVWDDQFQAVAWARVSLEAAARKTTPKRRPGRSKARKAPELLIAGPWDDDDQAA